jgi:hypothetical protein
VDHESESKPLIYSDIPRKTKISDSDTLLAYDITKACSGKAAITSTTGELSRMYEAAFRNIDDTLWKDAGYADVSVDKLRCAVEGLTI